ncbi:MAG TPA: PD-(D/E)XK nuclease family protein, partial [Bacillota bacterium]|nr:PD-(D/E)XK nuclease family protein [Bacillota bacterium]
EGRVYGYNRLGPFYSALQRQLDLLRQQGYFDRPDLFVLREASCLVRPPRWQGEGGRLEGWPDKRLLEPPPSRAEEAARLKAGHRGVILTSYTRMKRGQDWQPPAAGADGQEALRSEEIEGEALAGSPPAAAAEAGAAAPAGLPELPGGPAAGTFLHALLEGTDPAEIAALSYNEWSAQPPVQKRAAAVARRHGFAAEYLEQAMQIVYRAWRTPLAASSLEKNATLVMPGGIASGTRQRAEMPFVFPIPEKSHPLIGGGAAAPRNSFAVWPYRAVRGYLQGMIDLVFEHEGRVYVLDWKSDRLPAYDRDSLNAHVEANYKLQARIYVLAVLRLLAIRSAEEYDSRFGGVLYLFIRGLSPGKEGGEGEGIWFSRPPWARVGAWEQELLHCREWGGEVIALDEIAGEVRAP